MAKQPPRQSSPRVSTIASNVLTGRTPNPSKADIKALAGSVLSQDQTKGQGPKAK